jgi:hypothetical protein
MGSYVNLQILPEQSCRANRRETLREIVATQLSLRLGFLLFGAEVGSHVRNNQRTPSEAVPGDR